MPRESKKARAERAARIVRDLFAAYPDARCELEHSTPYELLVATILSAQCTDKRVNAVTPGLFARYPTVGEMAEADVGEVETRIHSTGFYRNKAKSLVSMAQAVVRDHGGEIPATLKDLVRLPGVGRKTANVVLGNAFDIPGMVVDTHVGRISRRLGLTRETDAVKVERDLTALIDREHWTGLAHAMIFHGRRVCTARKPACERCAIRPDCPSATAR
jgi:endonuclease-3